MVWLGVVLISACASAPKAPPLQPTGVVRVGRGPAVQLAPTTPASARRAPLLALFIDAGSRDGDAPFAAAVAAQLLSERVGRDAQARAFPDGVEVLTVCDDGLPACVARLAHGLALRAPSDAKIAHALAQLSEAERRARAADPERAADELAVRALWPNEAERFLPLDLRAAKSEPASYASVRAFIADAFGPSRALIAASGLVELDTLTELVESAFRKAPAASGTRAPRELAEAEPSAVEVAVDDRAAVSLALGTSDVASATRAANALRHELLRRKLARAIAGSTTSVRGGALAVLRVQPASSDLAALLSETSYLANRLRIEGLGTAALPLERDEPIAALRRIGVRYATGQGNSASDPHALALGIGVLVPGARADRVREQDPDAVQREREQARLSEAVQSGAQRAQPELTGELGEHAASVALPNHSRVAVQALPSDQVAIAVKVHAGAAGDPAMQHGRAALLATAMTVACAGRAPAALRAELAALGATLEPVVSADTLGIVLRAPAEHARAAMALAVECALDPSLARGNLIRARLLLLDRLRFAPRDLRLPRGGADLRAQVARALASDGAPGALAPWGGSSTLPSVDELALMELLDRALRGPSVSVAITGALGGLTAEQAAELAARRMTALPSQPAAAPKPASSSPARAKPASKKQAAAAPNALAPQAVEALVVWSAPACASENPEAVDAARAFAGSVSSALTASQLQVPWLYGDCTRGVAWAALLVRGPAERIAGLAGELARATASAEPKLVLQAAERATRRRAGTTASLVEHAGALADAAWSQAPPSPAAETPLAVIGRLRAARAIALPVE